MILTEEEAKTKWCPEARAFKSAGAPLNRAAAVNRWTDDGEALVKCCCIGSACMAWRWEGDWSDQKVHQNTLESWAKHGWVKVEDPFEASDGMITVRYNGHRIGYCGKAGKP